MAEVSHFPRERSVGKSVSEGILYDVVVSVDGGSVRFCPMRFCIAARPEAHFIGCFIPFVSHINPFAVILISNAAVSLGSAGSGIGVPYRHGVHIALAVGVETNPVVRRTHIDVGRGRGKIVRIGICQFTRRGDRSKSFRRQIFVKQAGNGSRTVGTGRCNDKAGVKPGNGFHKAQFHDVGGVDENDYVTVIFADVGEKFFFLGRNFKIRSVLIGHDRAAADSLFILNSGRIVTLA